MVSHCVDTMWTGDVNMLKEEGELLKAYMFIPGIPGPPKAFSGGLIPPP